MNATTSGANVVMLVMLVGTAFGWQAAEREYHAIASDAVRDLRQERIVGDSLREVLSVRPRSLKVERDSLVVRTAREVGVDPTLALAIAWVENPWADSAIVSRSGALGLMQVMPPEVLEARGETVGAKSRRAMIESMCGTVERIVERACNVRVGLTIYRDYLTRYGDEYLALAAYNGALRLPAAADRYVSAVQAARLPTTP